MAVARSTRPGEFKVAACKGEGNWDAGRERREERPWTKDERLPSIVKVKTESSIGDQMQKSEGLEKTQRRYDAVKIQMRGSIQGSWETG